MPAHLEHNLLLSDRQKTSRANVMNNVVPPQLNRRGAILIGVTFLAGAILAFAAWPNEVISPEEWKTWAVLTAITFAAQQLKVRFHRQFFYPNLVFFFAGIILLPPFLFILQVLIPHLVEWAWRRWFHSDLLQAWYVQPLNITTHVLTGLFAGSIYDLLGQYLSSSLEQAELVAAILAATIYVLLNHLITGEILLITQNISWQESQLLELDTFIPDLTLAMMGYVVAVLWSINPWMSIPALVPLILVYQALQVPSLKKEAETDGKTGLLNMKHFRKRLTEELDRSARFERPLSLIMADLDLMRTINNSYGHLVGDVVLEQIAHIIRENVREYDFACRFGGEEFIIALPETPLSGAHVVAERIRNEVACTPISVPNLHTAIQVTISLGIATFPFNARSLEQLLHEADIALYYAKQNGRNQVVSVSEVPPASRIDWDYLSQNKFSRVYNQVADTVVDTIKDNHQGREEGKGANAFDRKQPHPATSTTNGKQCLPATKPVARNYHQITQLGIGLAALFLLGIGLTFPQPHSDKWTLAFVAVTTGFAQLFRFPLANWGDRDWDARGTISLHPAVILLAILLAGIPGLAIASTVIGSAHYVRHRPGSPHQAVFKAAVIFIAGFVSWQIYTAIPLSIQVSTLAVWLPIVLVGGLLQFLTESGLFSAATAFDSGLSFYRTWHRIYRPLFGYYMTLTVLGLVLVLFYNYTGIQGLALLLTSMYSLHQIESRYAQGLVKKLKKDATISSRQQFGFSAGRSQTSYSRDSHSCGWSYISEHTKNTNGHAAIKEHEEDQIVH